MLCHQELSMSRLILALGAQRAWAPEALARQTQGKCRSLQPLASLPRFAALLMLHTVLPSESFASLELSEACEISAQYP